jgi:hypothetical protein
VQTKTPSLTVSSLRSDLSVNKMPQKACTRSKMILSQS